MCIHIHGKALVKTHAAKFVNKLVGFCEVFTAKTASMPSKWDTPSFRDLNSLLRLASGSGDYCSKGCGKIHADLFTQDECKFEQNKLSEPEKQELTKHKEECDKAKREKEEVPPTPEWKLTAVYEAEILEQATKFVVKRGEGDYRCMLCVDVESTDCKAACDAFGKKLDWATCKAYLEKHSKLQVSLQVSLLYHGHTLVRKQLKMQPG